MRSKRKHILVVGVGNPLRGDDGAGPAVVDALQPMSGLNVVCAKHSGEGASLMSLWQGFERVLLIDAVRSTDAPGAIHQIDARCETLPSGWFHYSSHAFGVAEAVELAKVLESLPPVFQIFGVEGECFTAGAPLSPSVQGQIETLATLVRRAIDSIQRGAPLRHANQ